jgi:hypothetical protein
MRPIAASILVVAALAAPLAAATPNTQPDPKQMTLRLADLPTGFAQTAGASYRSAKAIAKKDNEPVSWFTRHGYQSGYEAEFKRNGSLPELLSSANVVETAASVYRDQEGPTASLARTRSDCEKHGDILSGRARIGDEAILCLFDRTRARVYAIGWRHGRVRATVLIGGVKGGVSLSQAVKLAVRQDHHISAELSKG